MPTYIRSGADLDAILIRFKVLIMRRLRLRRELNESIVCILPGGQHFLIHMDTWHQPAESVRFKVNETEPPQDFTGLIVAKPVELSRSKFAEAKALIEWVCKQPV